MKSTKKEIRFGDVFWTEFKGAGHVQRGLRPGVVIQNDVGNRYSPNIIVVPTTTEIKRLTQPTHVYLPAEGTGMLYDSMILCENPVTIPRECIGEKITELPLRYLRELAKAALVSMPFNEYITSTPA